MKLQLITATLATTLYCTTALAGFDVISETGIPAKQSSSLKIGMGAAHKTHAYSDYDHNKSVIPLVEYNSEHVYAEGFEFGYKILEDQMNRLSFYLGMGADEFDATKSGKIGQLKDRDASIMLGTHYRHMNTWGLIDAKVAFDVSDESNGATASLSYGYPIQATDNWMIMPRGYVKWMDSDYADHYYGVNAHEANKIGVTPYMPGNSMKYGLELVSTYQLNKDWEINAGARYQWLDSDLKDSPMVSRDNETIVFSGLTYRFW